MAGWSARPGKGVAVGGVVVGLVIVIFGLVDTVQRHGFTAFAVVWLVVGLAFIGFNLWRAVGRRTPSA